MTDQKLESLKGKNIEVAEKELCDHLAESGLLETCKRVTFSGKDTEYVSYQTFFRPGRNYSAVLGYNTDGIVTEAYDEMG